MGRMKNSIRRIETGWACSLSYLVPHPSHLVLYPFHLVISFTILILSVRLRKRTLLIFAYLLGSRRESFRSINLQDGKDKNKMERIRTRWKGSEQDGKDKGLYKEDKNRRDLRSVLACSSSFPSCSLSFPSCNFIHDPILHNA